MTIALCLVIGSANLYYATLRAGADRLGDADRRRLAGVRRSALQGARDRRPDRRHARRRISLRASSTAPSTGRTSRVERSARPRTRRTNEAFALRPANLVLPVPQSRIAPLRRIASSYDHAIAPAYCESCFASLGSDRHGRARVRSRCARSRRCSASAGGSPVERLLRHASVGAANRSDRGHGGRAGKRARGVRHRRTSERGTGSPS